MSPSTLLRYFVSIVLLSHTTAILDPLSQCPSACYCQRTMLDCYGRELSEVPNDIPETTRFLNLENNQITNVATDRLSRLTGARTLLLNRNQITDLPSGSFANIPSLSQVDVSHNAISHVDPNAFNNLTGIKILSMNYNQLTAIDGILDNIPSLERLDLNSNKLTSISDDTFSSLPSLTYLSLSMNQISTVSKNAFSNLTKLSRLILSTNPLINLDGVLEGLPALSSLDMSSCLLTTIPTGIPETVRYLRLSNNSLTSVGVDDLKQVKQLMTIYLDQNEIDRVDSGAFSLPKISQIFLGNNKLHTLPNPIPANITMFIADNNQIQRLFQFNFDHDSNMRVLSLKNNLLDSLAANTFSRMTKLRSLFLDANNIQVLYQLTYARLQNLQMLSLDSNPVREIEKRAFNSLGRLFQLRLSNIPGKVSGVKASLFQEISSLYDLDLQGSPYLTASILNDTQVLKQLRSVKYLNLMNANLSHLDADIGSWLPRLRLMKLSKNPWMCDDQLIPLRKWMTRAPRLFMTLRILCQSPQELKGKAIINIELDQFTSSTAAPTTTSSTTTTPSTTIPITTTTTTPSTTTTTTTTAIPTTTTTASITTTTTQTSPVTTTTAITSASTQAFATRQRVSPTQTQTTFSKMQSSMTTKERRMSTTPQLKSKTTSLHVETTSKAILTSGKSKIPSWTGAHQTSSMTPSIKTKITTINDTTESTYNKPTTMNPQPTPNTSSKSSPTQTVNSTLKTTSTNSNANTTTQRSISSSNKPSSSSDGPYKTISSFTDIDANNLDTTPQYAALTSESSNKSFATARSGKSRLPAIASPSSDKTKHIIIGVTTTTCLFIVCLVILIAVIYRKRQKRVPIDNDHFPTSQHDNDSDTATIINGMQTPDTEKNSDMTPQNNVSNGNNGSNKKSHFPKSNSGGRFGTVCFSPQSNDDSEILMYSWDEAEH